MVRNKSSTKNTPLVSVVVLSWNTLDDTSRCLKSVLDMSYENIEVIVVDNGSTDGSKNYLSKLKNIKYIDIPKNTGFTGGQNEAYKASSGKYLALVNSDAVVAKDWLSILVNDLESDNKVGAAGGRAYQWNEENKVYDSKGEFYSYQSIDSDRGYARTLTVGAEKIEINSISGAAVIVRRSSVEKVGYFDNDFFAYFEETDLFARMRRAGYKILYEPKAHVWHKIAQSTKSKPWFYLYQMHQNRAQFALKNFDLKKAIVFWHLYSFDALKASIRYIKHKELDSKARVAAYWWNLLHLPHTIKKRQSVQKLGSTYSKLIEFVPRGSEVTVIIPCYNYAAFLSEAIESALNQTHKVAKIIVIDDGSTDESVKIAKRYISQGVEVISKKNEGVVATKNLGIDKVITDWTVFLDADDVLELDYIEKLMNVAAKEKSDVVYTDAQYFGANNDRLKSRWFSLKSLLRGNYIHNSALIGTDLLKSVGGYKNEMKGGYEDWELYITLAEAGARFNYTKSTQLLYRQHDSAESRNLSAKAKQKSLENQVRSLHKRSYRLRMNPVITTIDALLIFKRHPLLILFMIAGFIKSLPSGLVIYAKYVKHGALGSASKYMNRNS